MSNANFSVSSIEISAKVINECISDMLAIASNANSRNGTGYHTQFDVINSSFNHCQSSSLSKMDIARRLAIIDLFYTTNFNRFGEFGLDELTENIWNLCADGKGGHSDESLVKVVEAFVQDCCNNPVAAKSSPINTLFNTEFGVVKIDDNGNCMKVSPQSLISKYLYFLLENCHSANNTLGFPIYDSIANGLQIPLLKKLGIKKPKGTGIIGYVHKMALILEALNNPSVTGYKIWNMPALVCTTQFGLLDYFLWRIGKCGRLSFSLLWTKIEKITHYRVAKNKNQMSQAEFDSLPVRFRKWFTICNSITK